MKWTSVRAMPSSRAMPLRVMNGAWEPDQTVALLPCTSATAHDGPIIPCIWNGHRYVASNVFDACANAAATLPVLVADALGHRLRVLQVVVNRRSGPAGNCVGGADHVTFSARAARIAAHSVSATMPTKLPFCTIRTMPGIFAIDRSSTDSGVELTTGGRIDASVKHAGHAHVVRVRKAAANFVRQIESREPRCRRPCNLCGSFGLTSDASVEIPLLAAGRDLRVERACRPTSAAYETLFAELPVTLTTPSDDRELIHRRTELQRMHASAVPAALQPPPGAAAVRHARACGSRTCVPDRRSSSCRRFPC